MIKKLLPFLLVAIALISCDMKKSSVSGKVVNKITGAGIENAVVTFSQCKKNGDDCDEIVIGQVYTQQSGDFIINDKTASKSKTKWVTVSFNGRKLAQKDNVGLNDEELVFQVEP